ncbi:MAG: glycerol-3-phosphate responsive antiterminator [Candidatus Limnocylindrales bacterium]
MRIPRILVASDGRHGVHAPTEMAAGILIRDTDLAALVHCSSVGQPPDAVDIDSIAGLGGDDAAVDFVMSRLGIRIVLTRRPALAARAAEHGRVGLVHIFGYDSTGMARALESHPRTDRVGTVLSPGLVIKHLRPDELALLPRPVLAYGLIDDVDDAEACLGLADAIVVRPVLAARLGARAAAPGMAETPG